MLSTLFLVATLAQAGGGLFPSTSSDTGGIGSVGTPMGGVFPSSDPARDSSPLSSTGGATGSSGSAPGSGSSEAGATKTETSGRVSGGGTGTTGDSSTNGGTNSARPMR